MPQQTWTREDLVLHYEDILKAGLSAADFDHYKIKKEFPSSIVIQASSGSGGESPLLIPRSITDIVDINYRIQRAMQKMNQAKPLRVALIGGISHTQAAVKMKIQDLSIMSFDFEQIDLLNEYDPCVISCYPSILRNLLNQPKLKLKSLRGIKLGGEQLFASDLQRIQRKFPQVCVLEQYGSTEMPAIAIGRYENFKKTGLHIENDRFTVTTLGDLKWKTILVRDHFKNLLFPIQKNYNLGDEAILNSNLIMQTRRKEAVENDYFSLQEELLEAGCINLQINLQKSLIVYEGVAEGVKFSAHRMVYKNQNFNLVQGNLIRLKSSNKLPLICSLHV